MGKYNSDAETEIYRFIKILIVVIVLILGAYLFTNFIVNKEKAKKEQAQEVEISNNAIIVGSILNRPYDNYYVLAYKSKDNDSIIYETIISLYEAKKGSLKIYTVDLDNALNKNYYSEEGNNKASKIEDINLASPTLIKVSNQKISKYIEGKDNINKELGL